MLRDKFIHYFQQWRERQLSRGEHWLAQHLAGRSPREKGMLLAAVVFLFSVGYYVLIWQPLSERIEQQETILQQLVAMNTRLKSAAPDIIAARKSATTTPAQVSRVISDSASAHSVVIRRIPWPQGKPFPSRRKMPSPTAVSCRVMPWCSVPERHSPTMER